MTGNKELGMKRMKENELRMEIEVEEEVSISTGD